MVRNGFNVDFSIKKLYKAFMGIPQKKPWAKMICQNAAPPKCTFITWLPMHEKLATCSYLQRMGVHVDHRCCLCGNADETLDHMFFDCDVARAIWSGVTEWCGIRRQPVHWSLEKDFLVTQCTTNSGKQRLYICAITVLVYYIRREGNQRRMQGKQSTVEAVIKQCKLLLAWCSQNDRKLARFIHV